MIKKHKGITNKKIHLQNSCFFYGEELNMNKNKVWIIIGVIMVIIAILIFFLNSHYNFFKSGNTITNQSEEEIVENILNMQSYQATLSIEVETNKNKTQYVVRQSLSKGNIAKQEVIQPSNIAGITTTYQDGKLELSSPKLALTTIYENYPYVVENKLWLDAFVEDYKKQAIPNITTQNNQIILSVKQEDNNLYTIYKKLYIDKKTGKPTKMLVQDVNQKTCVYILYTEIEIS